MKRANTQKRTTSLGARLLSLLLAACMVAGLGWTAAGTAYAGDEVTNTVSLTETTGSQDTAPANAAGSGEENKQNDLLSDTESGNGQQDPTDVSEVNTPDPEGGTSSDNGNADTGNATTGGTGGDTNQDTTGVVPGSAEEVSGNKQEPQESGDGEPMAINDDAADDETVTTPKAQTVTYAPVTAEIPGQVKLTGDGFTEQRFSFGLRLDEETHTVQNEDGTTTEVSVEQNGVGFIRVAGITGATVKKADTYETFTFYETYTEPGHYVYSMYPVSYTNNAVEYDQHTFQLAVDVTGNEDHTLSYKLSALSGSEKFDHRLKSTGDTEPPKTEPASTTATIQGYKVLKGRDMAADEFQIGLELMQSPDVDVNRPKADIDVPGPGVSGEVDDEQGDENTILQSAAAAQEPGTDQTRSVAAGKDGQAVQVSFPMTYTLAGTYIYKMYEVDTKVDGIIYDTHECRVRVLVTKNDDGTLTASAPEYVGSSTFTNRVASEESVTVSIGGYKVLEGRDMQENEEFTFGLMLLSAVDQTEPAEGESELEAGMQNLSIHTKSTSGYAGGLSSSTVVTTTVKGAKNETPKAFTFPEITYYAPGTYTYRMYEVPGSDADLTYSETAYTVVVTVTETEEGTLAATVVYQDGHHETDFPYFLNSFNGLTLSFGGKKTLIGRNMTQDEFTFVLDSNPNNPATYWAGENLELVDAIDSSSSVQTLQRARSLSAASELEQLSYTMVGNPAAADGEQAAFTFPELTFVEPGTYEFAMLEIRGDDENVTYDTHVCHITVTVNSDFSYSISYNGSTSFVNQYQKTGTDGKTAATAVITGTKTLYGRDMKDGETFNFTLTPKFTLSDYGVSVVDETEDQDAHYNNYPTTKARAKAAASTSEGTISTTVLNASVSGAKDGQPVAVTFDQLQFTIEDVYVFEMQETKGGAEDIAYDSHTCKVYVAVSRDEDTGLLHAAVTYDGDNNFKNYSLSDATVTLGGTKTMIGRDMKDGEFQFKLTEVSRITAGNSLPTTKPIDLDDTETDTDSSKVMGYASAPAADSGETVPFAFDTITYTEPGIYNYTIEEAKGMDDVEYDERVYSVEVHVIATDEGLKVESVTYQDDDGKASDQADFVNYAGSNAELKAKKRLVGRDMENGEFRFVMTYTGYTANTFTRTKAVVVGNRDGKLLSESSNVLPQSAEQTYPKTITGYSTAAKARDFSEINFIDWAVFNEPGYYFYILSEVPGNDPDITYDQTEYAVVINVTSSETDGLQTDVKYYEIDGSTLTPCEEPSFTNVAQTVKTDLTCTKTLLGRDMENNEFSFGLYLISEPARYNNLPISKAIDLDDEDSYYGIASVGSGADGEKVNFTFENVTLTRAGTYVFGVRELYNYDPTISYDTHEGTITVTVGRDKDNKLVVKDVKNSETDFVNRVGVNVDLQASKTMVGRDMTEGEFSFTVTPPKSYSGVTVVTENLQQRAELNAKGQKNFVSETSAAVMRYTKSELKGPLSATGTAYEGSTVQGPAAKADTKTGFNLETLTFTKPGTYKFTIQETSGQETGIRYDTSTWTATVVVTKDMTATVTYTDSQGNTSTQADFVNRVTTTTTTPVKPKEPEETKKPTEPDEPTTVDDNPEDDQPQEPEVSEGPTQPEEPKVSEGPTQPEGPTVTEGPGDSLEDENTGTGLEQPQEDQTTENAPETSVKPTETAPETSAQAQASLPQTGQDWWPLLLLAAVGVLLIAAGVFHGKKRNI